MIARFDGLVVAWLLCFGAAEAVGDSKSECPSASSLIQRHQHRGSRVVHSSEAQPDVSMDVTPPTLASIPEKVLEAMVLPGPRPCEMYPQNAPTFQYCGGPNGCFSLCGHTKLSDGLNPMNISKSHPWRDSTRLLVGPIGALPCCPTPPHCKAHACKSADLSLSTSPAGLTCTKFPPETNYAYMTHPQVWTAYQGQGGSYDLDVEKHWDVLGRVFGCYGTKVATGQCHQVEPFDLTIDLGSDHGSVTESFVERRFTKDAILVDAWPQNKQWFSERFGNSTFLSTWYQKQVSSWAPGGQLPSFEFLSNALGNKSGGTFDMCDGKGRWKIKNGQPCPVDIMAVDSLIPGKLSPLLQGKVAQAQSAYIKIDLDGMDQLAISGMHRLLGEVRGTYGDGSPRYLVNFMMLEFCPTCMDEMGPVHGIHPYNLGTQVQLLENLGFEVFLMGPRYLPISHGSWTEAFNTWFHSSTSAIPGAPNVGAVDLFAMRASQPRAAEVKLALGACSESHEFDVSDLQ